MAIYLVGGGPESCPTPGLLDGFRDEVAERGGPLVVVLVEREGVLEEHLPRYAAFAAEGVELRPVLIGDHAFVDAADLEGAGGIAVAGGPTPRYHAGLHAVADTVRAAVRAGTPYAGFSAGAMIAGDTGLLGGHLLGALEVVHEDCSEGLAQICLEPGLGIVPFTCDVHAAQAGTLSRAVAIVDNGLVPRSVAIDEDTVLVVDGGLRVRGTGSAWFSEQDRGRVRLTRRSAGTVDLPGWTDQEPRTPGGG
jgi:cyanophycinase